MYQIEYYKDYVDPAGGSEDQAAFVSRPEVHQVALRRLVDHLV